MGINWLVTAIRCCDVISSSIRHEPELSALSANDPRCFFYQCEVRSAIFPLADLGAPFLLRASTASRGEFSGQTGGSFTMRQYLDSIEASSDVVNFFTAEFQEVPEPVSAVALPLGVAILTTAARRQRRLANTPLS